MKEYLSIKEFSEITGITTQAVYKRLSTDLKSYLKVIDNKKMLNTKALHNFNIVDFEKNNLQPVDNQLPTDNQPVTNQVGNQSNEVANQINVEMLNKMIDILERQLQTKDEQLQTKDKQIDNLNETINQQSKDLNERISELTKLQHNNQVLLLRKQEKEQEPDQEQQEQELAVMKDQDKKPGFFKKLFQGRS